MAPNVRAQKSKCYFSVKAYLFCHRAECPWPYKKKPERQPSSRIIQIYYAKNGARYKFEFKWLFIDLKYCASSSLASLLPTTTPHRSSSTLFLSPSVVVAVDAATYAIWIHNCEASAGEAGWSSALYGLQAYWGDLAGVVSACESDRERVRRLYRCC